MIVLVAKDPPRMRAGHQNKKSYVEKRQSDPSCHLRMVWRQIKQNEGIPV